MLVIEHEFLDDDCFLDIDFCHEHLIPWFLMASYEESNGRHLISPAMLEKLNQRVAECDDIEDKYKAYIKVKFRECEVVGYPEKIEQKIKEVRKIYGRNDTGRAH